MTNYRRIPISGTTWFFTVNFAERKGNKLLVDRIDPLRESFLKVRQNHPYQMDAIVILPDHLHCVLTLPQGDKDFSMRWGLIKSYFSRASNRANGFPEAARNAASGAYSKDAFGIISFGTRPIIRLMSIISIGIRLNMAMCGRRPNGLIRRSTDMSSQACAYGIRRGTETDDLNYH